jgi:hypothetical protein
MKANRTLASLAGASNAQLSTVAHFATVLCKRLKITFEAEE